MKFSRHSSARNCKPPMALGTSTYQSSEHYSRGQQNADGALPERALSRTPLDPSKNGGKW